MKSIFEQVILRGDFDLSALLRSIDSYHVQGALSDEDRQSLYALARQNARPTVDLLSKVAQLEKRVAALEKPAAPPAVCAPYEAGRWYYANDTVSFRDRNYICVAPEGVVCTWSPLEYPAYWKEFVPGGEGDV